MRFSFVILAVAAVTLAVSTVHADENAPSLPNANDLVEKLYDGIDAAGKKIEFITTGGDNDFDGNDEDGAQNVQPVRRSRKHHHRRGKKSTHRTAKPQNAKMINGNTKITWYASQDLQNPQCGDGKWNPTNKSHIGAVMAGWQGGPKCGEFVHLCHDDDNCLRVRIVDKCAGCKQNHVDLTKSAFLQLDPNHNLGTGVVNNLKLYQTSQPSPWDTALFGPLRLQG